MKSRKPSIPSVRRLGANVLRKWVKLNESRYRIIAHNSEYVFTTGGKFPVTSLVNDPMSHKSYIVV